MPDNEAGVAHLKTLSKVAVMLMNEQSRATLLDAADAASIAQVINDSITE
jgi:mannitol/fructose-specific phosphotransferase system IIA component (Ntr-type)